jgi:hypothetical protein
MAGKSKKQNKFQGGGTVEDWWQENIKEGHWDTRQQDIEDWNLGNFGEWWAKYSPDPITRTVVPYARMFERGWEGLRDRARKKYEESDEYKNKQQRLRQQEEEKLARDAEEQARIDEEGAFTWESPQSQTASAYEKGGKLKGPNHDNGGIDINVEGGEYIVKKDSVNQNTLDVLEYINSYGDIPSSDARERSKKNA